MDQFLTNNSRTIFLFVGAIVSLLIGAITNNEFRVKDLNIKNERIIKPYIVNGLIIFGLILIVAGIISAFFPTQPAIVPEPTQPATSVPENETLIPQAPYAPESIHITGMGFSSSCLATDYNLLVLDMQQVSVAGIPVYDGCGLTFQDIAVSSPDIPTAWKGKIEFFVNNTMIGTTDEKYLDRSVTIFDTVAPLESPYDNNYYTWKVPSGWGNIEARLVYHPEGDATEFTDTIKIRLNRSGTAYLIKPPIFKIQSISLSINEGPNQTIYAGDPKKELEVSIGDKVRINSLTYKAYSITQAFKIRAYLIKWVVSSSGSYSNSDESFSTQDQTVQSGFQEIDGFPWTLTVEVNNNLGVYLKRDDGSYADYMRINFVYK